MSTPTLTAEEITCLRTLVEIAKKAEPILDKLAKLSGKPRRGRKDTPRKTAALAMAGMKKKELEKHFREQLR